MLYLIPGPIGNLEDFTFRAVKTLNQVDLVLAEDTRTTSVLFKHYEIKTTLKSYHSFNEHSKLSGIIDQLKTGLSIALMSDAGTPGISDPGFLLVRACKNEGIPVIALPGATAFVPALVSSGIPCDKFFFEGFLPHKKGRHTRMEFLSNLPFTFIIYESPNRLLKTLELLSEFCGPQREAAVCREISKVHEEVVKDSLQNLLVNFKSRSTIKGEIVLIIGGKSD
jgi:16S rRNA (cytidine1402-2'-O)-methyltransferase